MIKRLRVAAVAATVAALAVTGCTTGTPGGTGASAGSSDDSTYDVAFIPMVVGAPYFETANTAMQEAAEEIGGINWIYQGPDTADAAKQSEIVQNMITRGVDAIVISAVDGTSVVPVLQQAMDAGIHVYTWDVDTDPDGRENYIGIGSMEDFGAHMVDSLVSQMGESGQYAVITGSLSANLLNERIDAIKAYSAETYPGLDLVSVEGADVDPAKAYTIAQNLLTAYPDLKGIISNSSEAAVGAARAVQQAGKQGQVYVTGISTPNVMKPYIADDSAQIINFWDLEKYAKLAVYVTKDLLDGKTYSEGTVSGYDGYDQLTYSGDVLLFNEFLDFTADNIDEYDY
ncbi:autoinducer 2 ABC transporter substrate-binding protein LsrB [Brooklawnia cerclae]|uniref:Rhamnose transport system substrate-binding protein n=1 Tax=Brooklawnia cerclae TaxID=349934 RepID=A0ABX0SIZ9_9ACTN|nr:autoinducer 2 ABC transporter substrate-binding protein [Brooklawnia cerclae]NIH57955.1 rhamnose transport system substrate-binding protein [Brooklawnia cerclae]